MSTGDHRKSRAPENRARAPHGSQFKDSSLDARTVKSDSDSVNQVESERSALRRPPGVAAFAPVFPPLARRQRRLWVIVTLLVVAAAALVRGGLLHALGTRNVYVTFYPAVVLAALYGGLRAGLLATLLSAFIVDYFWIEPSGLAIGDPADWLGVGVFVLGGTMISAVAEAMHRAQTRARVAEAEAHRAAARQQQQETLRQANAALRTANEELEQHVAERTAVVREQSRFLEAFYEHSLDSLVILDRQFNFIRVNEAYARECGRAVEDFPSHNHFESYPHAENQAIFENVVRTKVRHEVNAKPLVFPDHPEWGVIYRDWTLAPILDAQGEVDFLVFSLRDVTERNRAEAELARYRNHLEELIRVRTSELETTNTDLQAEIAERRRVEAQLRLQLAVLQSTANAIVVTGRDGTIEWVNAAFTQLTGYTAAEAVGQNLRVLNSGRQEAAFFAGMWQRILAGRVWHGELVNKRKDGSFYAEEMTITPVMGDQDQVAHFIAVKQDIQNAYSLHANCYIAKPVDFGQFMKVIKAIESFWLTIVKLPPPEPPAVVPRANS